METPILILEDALNQQKEQLSRTIQNSKKAKNEKQIILYDKAIINLSGFIANIAKAINILKSNERESDRKHRKAKEVCPIVYNDTCPHINNDNIDCQDGCEYYRTN